MVEDGREGTRGIRREEWRERNGGGIRRKRVATQISGWFCRLTGSVDIGMM
jgi:hypothetical protein